MESEESRPDSSASYSTDASHNSEESGQSCNLHNVRRSRSSASSKSASSCNRLASHQIKSPSQSPNRSRSGSQSSQGSDNNDVRMLNMMNDSQTGDIRSPDIRNSTPDSAISHDDTRSSDKLSNKNINITRINQSPERYIDSRNSNVSSISAIDPIEDNQNQINGDTTGTGTYRARKISHDDLSDVSDIDCEKNESENINDGEESKMCDDVINNKQFDDFTSVKAEEMKMDEDDSDNEDLRHKLDLKKNQLRSMESDIVKTNGKISVSLEDDIGKKHDEDALDFEAEDGECADINRDDEKHDTENLNIDMKKSDGDKDDLEEGEELEEGEVTDEEEKRPEETEPKPVCRFYTRGQCTWGMNCRFLHPGVTDKGNYTMFDMVRPVSVPHGGGGRPGGYVGKNHGFHDFPDRPPIHHRPMIHHPGYIPPPIPHHDPRAALPPVVIPPEVVREAPVTESAWERGLRTAKEMMRKANKRKEQDIDFEDKKMNITSHEELEKDNFYIRDRRSPDVSPPFTGRGVERHGPAYDSDVYNSSLGGNRYGPRMSGVYEEDAFGRTTRYRELPPHRMPHYEDARRVRPTREVIVQRAEPIRDDDWNDPWMRSKSPHGGGGGGGGSVGGGDYISHDNKHNKKIRRHHGRRSSYSSNSSYSSSSSTHSESSSETSQSPQPQSSDIRRRNRYNSTHSSYTHRSSPPPPPQQQQQRRHMKINHPRSPITMKKRSPDYSPMKRHHISPNKISSQKSAGISPTIINKRKIVSPTHKKTSGDKIRKRKRDASSSSNSDSSESSESGSKSSYSTSSASSSGGNTPIKRPPKVVEKQSIVERKVIRKGELPKKRSPISMEIKKPSSLIKPSTPDKLQSSSQSSSKKPNRREELLKQLRAVEDAIARKRSKLN